MDYEPAVAWEAFYEELDPQTRHMLLEEAIQGVGDDGANALRQRLFAERYPDAKRGSDAFLLRCLYLPTVFSQRRGLFSPLRKEARKTVEMFHLEHPEALGEAERAALYLEFRNVARRYLETCRSERYGRKLMGLMAAGAEEKLQKTCEDIWTMSRGIALASGKEAQLRLLCDAFRDELLRFDPRCGEMYDAFEARFRGAPS